MSRGRPRKQSIEQTLDLALDVFRRKGYDSTSVQDLSEAVGLGPSSLYNSFGSKDALYLRCMERYIQQNRGLWESLKHPEAIEALEGVLVASANLYAADPVHRGCAILSTSPLNTPEGQHIDAFFDERRRGTLEAWSRRIQQGIDDGHLRPDTPIESLARFLMSVCQGMSAQACDGATQAQLLQVAAQAKIVLRTWAAWPSMPA